MNEPNIDDLLDKAHERVRAQRSPNPNRNSKPGPALLRAINAGTIYKTDYPPPVFAVDQILPQGLTLAAGRPKVGKSWAALQTAVAVAFGEILFSRFRVRLPGRVTYLALEEPAERTHHRLCQVVPAYDVWLENIQFLYQIQPLMSGGATQLDAFLTANPSEAVIIDTLLAMVAAHSSRKDVLHGDYTEVNTLRQIAAKHKTEMLCIAHLRKAAGDIIDTVLGTSGTTAACDSVWSLKRSTTASEEGVLEVVGRDFEGATFGLKFSKEAPFGWRVTAEGADAAMSDERRDILMLLQQEGAKKPAEIARMLVKNANTVRRLVQKLVFDGIIKRQSDGTYVPVPGVNA